MPVVVVRQQVDQIQVLNWIIRRWYPGHWHCQWQLELQVNLNLNLTTTSTSNPKVTMHFSGFRATATNLNIHRISKIVDWNT